MKLPKIVKQFRIDNPEKFRLADCDPADTGGLYLDRFEAEAMLEKGKTELSDLQERLYAQDCWAVLAIFQGLDAAGKDGAIKHVLSGVNPQGCDVSAFKTPTSLELDHDFMWRTTRRLPERGRIGIFNRSYYEEVLVVRVHPEILARQKLPPALVTKDIWKQRFKDIRAFERYLARNGILLLKFFLHISPEEQRRRLLARIDEPAKRWKFNMGDIAERKLWDKYMAAYEDMVRETSRPEAPWYVVPADQKWFARVVVAAVMVKAMKGLDLQFPEVKGGALAELAKVRRALLAEGGRASFKARGRKAKPARAKPSWAAKPGRAKPGQAGPVKSGPRKARSRATRSRMARLRIARMRIARSRAAGLRTRSSRSRSGKAGSGRARSRKVR